MYVQTASNDNRPRVWQSGQIIQSVHVRTNSLKLNSPKAETKRVTVWKFSINKERFSELNMQYLMQLDELMECESLEGGRTTGIKKARNNNVQIYIVSQPLNKAQPEAYSVPLVPH